MIAIDRAARTPSRLHDSRTPLGLRHCAHPQFRHRLREGRRHRHHLEGRRDRNDRVRTLHAARCTQHVQTTTTVTVYDDYKNTETWCADCTEDGSTLCDRCEQRKTKRSITWTSSTYTIDALKTLHNSSLADARAKTSLAQERARRNRTPRAALPRSLDHEPGRRKRGAPHGAHVHRSRPRDMHAAGNGPPSFAAGCRRDRLGQSHDHRGVQSRPARRCAAQSTPLATRCSSLLAAGLFTGAPGAPARGAIGSRAAARSDATLGVARSERVGSHVLVVDRLPFVRS